jgi:hypothetical protein
MSLLPDPKVICRIAITDGLYKSRDGTDDSSGKLWIVRANAMSFTTQSAIPASQLRYGDGIKASAELMGTAHFGEADVTIDVAPMNLTGVTSVHVLAVYDGSGTLADVSGWSLAPRQNNIPASLWGTPPVPFSQIPGMPSADVVPNQMTGYAVQAPAPALGDPQRGPVAMSVLLEEYLAPSGQSPLSLTVGATSDAMPSFNDQTIGEIQKIMDDDVTGRRDALYALLQSNNVYTGGSGVLTNMQTRAAHLFTDSPLLAA